MQRLPGGSGPVVEFARELPGPVRATYEVGPTGFVLARKLAAAGVDCLVCAPGLIPRGAAVATTKARIYGLSCCLLDKTTSLSDVAPPVGVTRFGRRGVTAARLASPV